MMRHKYKKITVKWADHFIDYGEYDISDIQQKVERPYMGEYTGFLVAESKQMVAISSNIWEDGTISDPMFIMKKSIIK